MKGEVYGCQIINSMEDQAGQNSFLGESINLQGGVSIDTKGNIAIQGSSSGGVTIGSPSLSATLYGAITTAPSINELEGMAYQIGGSVAALPVTAGGRF